MSEWQQGAFTVGGLGEWVDGWADLLSGLGERHTDMVAAFQKNAAYRNMPNINLIAGNASVGGFVVNSRQFYFARTRGTGATVAVYIGRFGTDLYLSWDLYMRRVFNWRTLLILAGIALALALIPSGLLSAYDPWTGRSGFNLGYVLGNLPAIAISSLPTFGFLVLLTAFLGLVMRGSFLAFFFRQLNIFDVDDIKALSLAVHKAIGESADQVGIDSHLLRLKEQFRAGSRDRLI